MPEKNSLLGLSRGAEKYICLNAAMLSINGAAYIALISFLAEIIKDVSIFKDAVIRITVVLVIKIVVLKFESLFSYKTTVRVKSGIRKKIFDKIKVLGPAYTDNSGTAELIADSIDGVEALEVFFGRFLPQLVYSFLIPFILFFVTYRIYPAFAVVLLCAVPVIPLSMMLITKWAKRSMSRFWEDYQGLSSIFLENLQGIVTLKLFNKSEKRMSEMENRAWGFRNSTMELLKMQLTSISVMDTLVYSFAGAGIFLAVYGFYNGNLTLSEFFILLMLSVEFFLPVRKLGSLFHAGVNGIQAGRKIVNFLGTESPLGTEGVRTHTDGSDIEFDNVSFSYGKNLPDILENTTYRFPAGRVYGIFGESGCGKSTLGKLMLRFYDTNSGVIRLGGVPLEEISAEYLRRHITLVETNSRIFSGTIRDNLRLAGNNVTDKEILDACRAAGLKGTPERRGLVVCENDLYKETGEGGAKLSGGERQRLAIARAIILDPDIFIFDEAAGSVDAESEEIIKQTIQNLPSDKTIFIISHRMSMLKGVDSLLTIECGRIVDKEGILSCSGNV